MLNNEYSVKQAAFLYLKMPLKPAFFKCVFIVCRNLSLLNLFISEYLDKILPWKEMKLEFSGNIQDFKNLCFCLR